MKYPAIKYKQSNFSLITTVLPFEIISSNSKALIYGEDDGGYQRKQDVKHFQNIRKYIEQENFVFPNSIILACDEEDVDQIYIPNLSHPEFGYLELDNQEKMLFRIVDGQHRILGIQEAFKSNNSLKNLELQVNIISTLKKKRSVEMDIFTNINSKAKRLKTDLIELAKYDYRIIEQNVRDSELVSHISINTAFELNENFDKDNVWQNAIKIDIHSENKLGIIGVKAFNESINGIVSHYLRCNKIGFTDLSNKALIDYSKDTAKIISGFIYNAWKIIKDKWPEAFLEPFKSLDIDSEYKYIAYNSEYYIQKTLGCKSINYLLSDILKENPISFNEVYSLENFQEIIFKSKLNSNDWRLGKTLSGISSESGFKKVSKIIRNEEPFIRKD